MFLQIPVGDKKGFMQISERKGKPTHTPGKTWWGQVFYMTPSKASDMVRGSEHSIKDLGKSTLYFVKNKHTHTHKNTQVCMNKIAWEVFQIYS